jgi:hypothetical protein
VEQEDFIKKQIDQLGLVLGKILSDLLGIKTQGHINERIEIINHTLKNLLDLDVDDMITIPPDKFIDTFQVKNKLTDNSFEMLANILFILGDEVDLKNNDKEKNKKLYQRALIIYEYLNSKSSTYSFERHLKVEKIKNAL